MAPAASERSEATEVPEAHEVPEAPEGPRAPSVSSEPRAADARTPSPAGRDGAAPHGPPDAPSETPAAATDHGDGDGGDGDDGDDGARWHGPPDDATTTFEDLPGDLFGETEPPLPTNDDGDPGVAPSAASRGDDAVRGHGAAGGSTDPAPRGTSAIPARATGRPSSPEGATVRGEPRAGAETGAATDDDAIAMVQSLFPGRIVAVEPDSAQGSIDGAETDASDEGDGNDGEALSDDGDRRLNG